MKRAFPSLIAALALAVITAGCGGSEKQAPPVCDLPEPVGDLSELPRGLPLDVWGNVTEIEVSDGFLSATAVTETGIIELSPVMARAVSDSGHTILAGDNEGFEAEIFFERGEGTTGTFRLREGPCAEQVTIRLLYEAERYRRDG